MFRRGNPSVLLPLKFLASGSPQALRAFAMTKAALAARDDKTDVPS